MQIFSSSIGIGLIAVCSVSLIAMSRKIAAWMFKNDE